MTTIFLLAFWVFLLGTITLVWRAGDREDRVAISIICCAAVSTGLVNQAFALQTALVLVVFIDFALLAFLVRYATVGQRYWPIWFAGLHAAICIFSLASVFIRIETLRLDLIGGLWAMAALVAMTVGLLIDQHKGVAAA